MLVFVATISPTYRPAAVNIGLPLDTVLCAFNTFRFRLGRPRLARFLAVLVDLALDRDDVAALLSQLTVLPARCRCVQSPAISPPIALEGARQRRLNFLYSSIINLQHSAMLPYPEG